MRFLIGGERVTCYWSKLSDALGRTKLNDALGKQHLELWTCTWSGRASWNGGKVVCQQRQANNFNYYSFKIFSRFWLVKTTRIIHHNQLLFTKFGKNLLHIESMTSKVESTENYWTNDVKMTSKVQPATGYWTVDQENLGTRLCYIWWAEKQRA